MVVGDLHSNWSDADRRIVENGGFDLVAFVGDLGDEDVAVVRSVANLAAPKVVMLGNHDAWQSFSNKYPTARLRQILQVLGEFHLAYGIYELPAAGISLIGARPFSWGGPDLRSPEVYDDLWGIRTMRQSARRIADLATQAQHKDLVILAHNGPLGLSQQPSDIYGKDFGKRPGGDWGDRDLALALDYLREDGYRVRAVIAGHMHHALNPPHGGHRSRFIRHDGTLHLNCAVVPRIRPHKETGILRYFLRTRWADGQLVDVEEVWIDAASGVEFAESPVIKPFEPARPC